MSPGSALKCFSLNTKFSAKDAREDKVDLIAGEWCVDVDEESFAVFRDHLASPPKGESELAFTSEEPREHGWLFLRPQTKGKNWNKLRIRKQPLRHPKENRRYGSPLAAGFLEFFRTRKGSVATGARLARLRLSLNLQRFIRHQPKGASPSGNEAIETPRITARTDDRSRFGDEFAWDGQDNWIPDTEPWSTFATRNASRRQMRRYLKKLTTLFESEANRAMKQFGWGEGSFEQARQYHSLSCVETAWEFASDDPIQDVLEIGQAALQLSKRGKVTAYLIPRGKVRRELNSPSFEIPLAENVDVRIYAKTNRRIRFEVVQRELWKQWTALVEEADLPPGVKRQKRGKKAWVDDEPRPVADLMKALKALRRRAAEHLNRMMEQLRKGREDGTLSRPMVDLLAEISAAMPVQSGTEKRARLTRALLHLLTFQRGYRGKISPESGDELSSPLAALKKRKVIRWDSSRQFYVLAPEFVCAADALRDITGDPFLAVFGDSDINRRFFKSGKRLIRDRGV